MGRLLAGILALALVGLAGPAAAGATSGKVPGLVCTYEKTTGSNLKRRVCTTARQRDERRREDQDAAQRTRSRGPDTPSPVQAGGAAAR